MAPAFKPNNYSSVSPYLVVNGAAAAIEFLKRAFSAIELRSHPGAPGKLAHAEVRIDDSVVMLWDGMEGWPALPTHVHVYVSDVVDATYRRALAAGASSVQEPVRKGDEDKRGGVKDPSGTTWWIATQVV